MIDHPTNASALRRAGADVDNPLTAQSDQFSHSNELALDAADKGFQIAEGTPIGMAPGAASRLTRGGFGYACNLART